MNSRRAFVKNSALATAALVAVNPLRSFADFAPSVYGGEFSNENSITILHTADLSDQWDKISDGSSYDGLGGLRSMKTVINGIRNEWKNHMLVDAGGMKPGIFESASKLEYDAININTGVEDMELAINGHQLPAISHHPEYLKANAVPYRIINKGNNRIGIISANLENGSGNPMIHALETSRLLKKEKDCQLVICLSNLGDDRNKKVSDHGLASRSTDIDIIIGSGSGLVSRTPFTAINKERREVIINYSGYRGLVLGKIDLLFNENAEKTAVHFRNLVIGSHENRWKDLPSGDRMILS